MTEETYTNKLIGNFMVKSWIVGPTIDRIDSKLAPARARTTLGETHGFKNVGKVKRLVMKPYFAEIKPYSDGKMRENAVPYSYVGGNRK